MKSTFTRVGALILGGSLMASTAGAIEIISNMPGNDGTSTFMNAPLGGSNGGGVHDSKAAGFTIAAGTPYDLDFVTLRINYFDVDSVPMVQIYDDVAGNPANLLHTLTAPAPVIGMSNVQFTSAGFTLNASTTYWMVVWNNAAIANSFQWMASSPSVTPVGLATTAGYRFSNNGPPPTGSSSTFNSYSIDATPVPEPATFVALGLGALLLLGRRR
jgi:hypothetical protein